MADARWKEIVVVDDREGSAPGETIIAIGADSPWYDLLPDFQVVQIYDGPHRLRTTAAIQQLDALRTDRGK